MANIKRGDIVWKKALSSRWGTTHVLVALKILGRVVKMGHKVRIAARRAGRYGCNVSKYKTDKVMVVGIYYINSYTNNNKDKILVKDQSLCEAYSMYDRKFTYSLNEIVSVPLNRSSKSAGSGIYFFKYAWHAANYVF